METKQVNALIYPTESHGGLTTTMKSAVIYYSNQCEASRKLLQAIANKPVANSVHFVCIDTREKSPTSEHTMIIMPDGARMPLPPTVTRVPAIMKLSDYSVAFGDDIYVHLQTIVPRGPPQQLQQSQQYSQQSQQYSQQQLPDTMNDFKPWDSAGGNFFGGSSLGGVVSDSYSFLDGAQSTPSFYVSPAAAAAPPTTYRANEVDEHGRTKKVSMEDTEAIAARRMRELE